MASRSSRKMPWTRPAQVLGSIAALGAVVTLAVVAPGYDVQEVPTKTTSLWVTRDDGQYARLNTELGHMETVKRVAEPANLVQSGADALLYTQGLVNAWPLDAATPTDLVESGPQANAAVKPAATPSGTVAVEAVGSLVTYRTSTGEVYVSSIPKQGEKPDDAWKLDPFASLEVEQGQERPTYVADAVGIDPAGRVIMYSGAEGGVRVYDIDRGGFDGDLTPIPQAAEPGEKLSMATANGSWVLYSATRQLLWIEGQDAPIETTLGPGALLQQGPSTDGYVYLADDTGLVRIAVAKGTVEPVVNAEGEPATPVVVNGVAHAAWVSTTDASMWSGDAPELRPLDIDTQALASVRDVNPQFRTNGDVLVLNESATGMVWTVPDGVLIPVAEWSVLDGSEQLEGAVDVEDVIDQQPPVARADSFGVRRGGVVTLPVLLNDSDPNAKDVLTIDDASLTELSDPAFGTISLVGEDQAVVVRVNASEGSATFNYAVTDGVAVSGTVTVTLTVIPDDVNTAPAWCPMDDCTQKAQQLEVAPGAYASLQALNGWVDPEGDPITLADARPEAAAAPVTVVPTSDGRIVVRHLDPNASAASIPLTMTVMDSLGATTTAPLTLTATPSPTLVAKPIAIAGAAQAPRSIDVADWVSGGSGSYRIVEAVAASADKDLLTVAASAGDGTIQLEASKPGSYSATYTIEDTATLAQQTATIRFTCIGESRNLAAVPLTAFVRMGEDTTVDVLSSIVSPSGRVLSVRDAVSDDPRLNVGVVDQSYVRVRATTTDLAPGPLGIADVTITDGAGLSVKTQLSVFLIEPTRGIGPVSVPDVIAVRAGEQIDIPVLANDIAPRGERLRLHPSVEGSGTAGELAFTSGGLVRYLAPQTPGTYTLNYSTFLESDPRVIDTSTITVTVAPEGANRAPQAPALVGRAYAGSVATVALPKTSLDPDGDAVIVAAVAQPAGAVATIAATGDAITVRVPQQVPDGGQLTFTYRLADSRGATSEGTVTIAVTEPPQDVMPVTYGDYLSARLNSSKPVFVQPALNDRDVAQGELTLIDLRPNAVEGTAEFDRLNALIDPSTSLKDGKVALLPGDVEGTHSYVYTVESSANFSTATGLIVVGVTDEPAPDAIQVTDTTVSAADRRELVSGIDVVSGKVQWATGDAGGLKLAVWGDAAQQFVATDNVSISGTLPQERTVVPFSLTGVNSSGEEQVGYGFLRIPALDDMRIQLKQDAQPIIVDEEKSVDVKLRDLLQLDPQDELEIRQDESFPVQRANATCTPFSDGMIRYSAGREAPFTDSCAVAVRVKGQKTWTIVAIGFRIQPKDPLAILSPVALTITPGATDEVAMIDQMVSWEGGRVGKVNELQLNATYTGSNFEVTVSGNKVSIVAYATAVPGTRETIKVDTPQYGGLTSAITLLVGPALPDKPRGATFSETCDVSKSSSCMITAIGRAGEYDPYEGKLGGGLVIKSVGSSVAGTSATCPVATVSRASDTQLVATWPSASKPVGGECTIDFTVQDAQGNTGPGRLSLNVLGYPQAPASVTTAGYTGSSVTLQVALGQATAAHPAVSGVTLWEDGRQVNASCAPSGATSYRCDVGGLVNGEKHRYSAKTVNSVGESSESSAVETWAYQAPRLTELTAEPAYRPGRTTVTSGVVVLSISGSDDSESYTIEGGGPTVSRTGEVTTTEITLDVGNRNVTVTPNSRFHPPIPGGRSGDSKSLQVVVAGAPRFTKAAQASADQTVITVTGADLDANYSDLPISKRFVAWTSSAPTCTMGSDGKAKIEGGSGVVSSSTATISDLSPYTGYTVAVCASNGYGAVMSQPAYGVFTWVEPGAPTGSPMAYEVATTPTYSASGATTFASFGLLQAPNVNPPRDGNLRTKYTFSGSQPTDTFRLTPERIEDIRAVYCSTGFWAWCGNSALIKPKNDTPPTTVDVSFTPPASGCVKDPRGSDIVISPAASGYAAVTIDSASSTYSVTFSGPFSMLDSVEFTYAACPPDPDPTPNPTPTPTPTPSPGP